MPVNFVRVIVTVPPQSHVKPPPSAVNVLALAELPLTVVSVITVWAPTSGDEKLPAPPYAEWLLLSTLDLMVSEPRFCSTPPAPPTPAVPLSITFTWSSVALAALSSVARAPPSLLWLRVSVEFRSVRLPSTRTPPPRIGFTSGDFPCWIVTPDSVRLSPRATSSTRDALAPSILTELAPAPLIVRLWLTVSSPRLSVYVPVGTETTSPAFEWTIASRRVQSAALQVPSS